MQYDRNNTKDTASIKTPLIDSILLSFETTSKLTWQARHYLQE